MSLRMLWKDETGAVLSAELLLVGTLGIVGATAGLAAVGDSVDGEMEELAYSLRSLDQSYRLESRQSCGAWTAGSCYTQPSVEESHARLRRIIERERERKHDRDGDRDVERMRGDEPREEQVRPRRRQNDKETDRDMDRRRRDREENERWDGDERRDEARGSDDEREPHERRSRDRDDERRDRDDDRRDRDDDR